MIIHDISPVAFGFGPVEVRFYSLAFAGGLVSTYLLLRWIWRREGWGMDDLDSLVVYLFFGLVVGARLGEVLFYHPEYYFGAPLEILKIWKGGLASHGATIGLLVSYLAFLWGKGGGGMAGGFAARWTRGIAAVRRDFWKYADGLAVGIPLAAGFVRIGNFFNSEIVGRVFGEGTGLGVVFVRNGDDFARHPVQLYEGAWLWLVCLAGLWLWVFGRRLGGRVGEMIRTPGFFLFFFVGVYFAGRFVLEFFKEYQVLDEVGVLGLGLTMGQWLSVLPVGLAVGWFGARAIVKRGGPPGRK